MEARVLAIADTLRRPDQYAPLPRRHAGGARAHDHRRQRRAAVDPALIPVFRAFTTAACEVLAQEMGHPVEVGTPRAQGGPYRTEAVDVTAIIGFTHDIEGTLFLGLTRATSVRYVARVAGAPVQGLDDPTQSGVGELAIMIAGRAGAALAALGQRMNIAPPLLVVGRDVVVSTLAAPRLCVPLHTSLGEMRCTWPSQAAASAAPWSWGSGGEGPFGLYGARRTLPYTLLGP